MGTLTTNYEFMKPTVGGDKDRWADDYPTADASGASPGLVGNWRKMDDLIRSLTDQVASLESGLPPGTYYEAGSDYLIVGETLTCWGTVISQSYDVEIAFPKRFTGAPVTLTTCRTEDGYAQSYISDVGYQVGTLVDQASDTHVVVNGGNSNYVGMPVDWIALGRWDGVS